MTELEKIAYTKSFIDKLANGINPLDDTPIPENDLTNNVRLSRCFFYVSDILRQVIENGGVRPQVPPCEDPSEWKSMPLPTDALPTRQPKRSEFTLTEEERRALVPTEKPILVSDLTKRLNEGIDRETVKSLHFAAVNNWLLEAGFLESVELPNGKYRKAPTEAGLEIGIENETRRGMYGEYTVTVFTAAAQQFIFDHIDAIVEANRARGAKAKEERKRRKESDRFAEFHARPWTETHDGTLAEMLSRGRAISEIAYELGRTEEGVRARIEELGLNANG